MRSHIRNSSLIVLLVVAVTTTGVLARAAGATPIDDKRAQAQAIQDQIDSNGQHIAALGEQLDGAQLQLDRAEATIADAQTHIEATQREVARIHRLVEVRAAMVYRRAIGGSSLDFDVQDVHDLVPRRKYAAAEAGRDDTLLRQLKDAQQKLASQKADAEQARADATAERTRIEQSRGALEAANAQQQQTLDKVQGEVAQLVAEEQQRREAEALARAQARYASPTAATTGNANAAAFPNVPPASSAAAVAIQFARAQLGKPYVYAAAGPDAYDCSGLTMAAWRAAGVSLPHYSGAQYSMLPKVPLSQMQPGDLVFWGPGGSQHVGIYIGAGMMIHAPHTGDVVKIAAVYGSPVGAGRPGV